MPAVAAKSKAVATKSTLDREVALVFVGALAMLFGWLLITNTEPVAQKMFQCVPVQSLDGVKVVVTCETSPNSILAVEIAGAALGICGVVTVLVGAVNWSS
jgi:hypothetical protein